jgi:hypothetical protein
LRYSFSRLTIHNGRANKEIASMTSTTIASRNPRPGVQRYLGLGLRAAVLATVVNVALYAVGKVLLNLPLAVPMQAGMEPSPLPVFMVILMSAVPGVLAAGVLYGLHRFTRRGLAIFQALSAVLALLSLGGPLSLPVDGGTIALLASMHLAAAVAIVGVLTVLSPRDQQE